VCDQMSVHKFSTSLLCYSRVLLYIYVVAAPAATHQCYVNGSVVQCGMGNRYDEGVSFTNDF